MSHQVNGHSLCSLSLLLSCHWVQVYFWMLFSPKVLVEQELTLAHQGSSRTSLWKAAPSQVLALGTGKPGLGSTRAPEQEGVGEMDWAVQGTLKVPGLPLPSDGRQVKAAPLSSLS